MSAAEKGPQGRGREDAAPTRRDVLKSAAAIAAAPAARDAARAAGRLDRAAAAFMARLLR